MTLKGKTLFITGASRGIGLAIGKRAAAGNNNHRPALIVSLHRIQAVDEGIGAGQAAAQLDDNQTVRDG